MKIFTTRTALALGAVGIMLASSTQAVASLPTGKHCVGYVHQGAPSATPELTTPRCFATFAEAIAFGSGGTLKLDPTASQAEQVAELTSLLGGNAAVPDVLETAADTSGVLLGTDFVDIDYGGASWSWFGQTGCHWYTNDAYATMPAGWNDVVSSAASYNGCGYFWHYENSDGSGLSKDCGWRCSYIGDPMNDRTSEIKFSYWG